MRKFVVFVISFVVIISSMSLTAFAAVSQPTSNAYIDNVNVSQSVINAGEEFNVSFYFAPGNSFNTYYNNGRGTVTITGEGFTLSGYLAEVNASVGMNSISVLSDEALETGRHQITINVTYTYQSFDGYEGEEGAQMPVFSTHTVTASKTLNIDVEGSTEIIDESSDSATFKLVGASIPETKGRSNLSTTLKLSVQNTTNYSAEGVKVTLSNLGDIILNTYTDTIDAGDVAGGQTINASFPIKFPEFPKAQSTLVATVTYTTPEGPKEQNFNVFLQATEKKEDEQPPESAALKPKVIVSQFNTDVEEVMSGEVFTLSFVLENTSTEKDLRNMTVNVTPQGYTSSSNGTSSGPVFSLIDGTSSFYTDSLEKGGTLEYSIRLKCSASTGAGSYPIKISYDYEYAEGNNYQTGSGENDINLPVSQPIKFDLLDWTPPTESSLSGVPISFQYYNKSRNPMTSLTISVEGDFEMPVQTIGTLAASSYDFFNGNITPVEGAKVGDTKTAILVFTFEDAAGEEKRIEEKFDVTIVEDTGMSDGMMDGMMGGADGMMGGADGMMGGVVYDDWGVATPSVDGTVPAVGDNVDGETSGLPLWAKIVIPSAIALIVIVVIVVVVKKVKAKRELEDDED